MKCSFKPVSSILSGLFLCVFVQTLPSPSRAQASDPEAEDASSIMRKVDQRYTGDSQIADSTLVLIDKRGRSRTRALKLFSLDSGNVERSIIFFLEPSDVRGTSYMSFDWEEQGKQDESWLYLPALKQVRRVASSDDSESFMGSDFTYADINGLEYDEFNYEMIRISDTVDGHDCWVIGLKPKTRDISDRTGIVDAEYWVRKDLYLTVQAKINSTERSRVKYFSAGDIENIDGVWTAKTLQMITTRNGKKEHASVIKTDNVRFNESIDESIFSTQAMQRGI